MSRPYATPPDASRVRSEHLHASMPVRSLLAFLSRPFSDLTRIKHEHTLMVGGSVAVLLGGLSALAMAVAPMTPDIELMPQRVVSETVQPLNIGQQLEDLAGRPATLSRTLLLRGPDGVAAVLRRAGVWDTTAAAQLPQDDALRAAFGAKGVRAVELRFSAAGPLQELVVRLAPTEPELASTHFQRLTSRLVDGRWTTTAETAPLEVSLRMASGMIRSSLFAATDDAGLPDAVAIQMAEIFGSDIDFHRELRKGDTFSVVYESLMADGQPVAWGQGAGRVMATEFVNAGRSHQAIWFMAQANRPGGYYDFQGRSRKRAFLASPLEFSRVTSGYAMRTHPIWGDRRPHRGVDYGAPTGTPVRSVGDGVVEFAGTQGGYGQVVEVRHSDDRSTVYAHLSHIDVRKGQKIEQGQAVGAVGATGWATGPHLHFEFRVAGAHHDPLEIARQADTATLDATARDIFGSVAGAMKGRLELAQATATSGRARFE